MIVPVRQFMCFFCREGIEQQGDDPCAIVLVTSWTKPRKQQKEQQFWCHVECFRRAAPAPLYVLDMDDKNR